MSTNRNFFEEILSKYLTPIKETGVVPEIPPLVKVLNVLGSFGTSFVDALKNAYIQRERLKELAYQRALREREQQRIEEELQLRKQQISQQMEMREREVTEKEKERQAVAEFFSEFGKTKSIYEAMNRMPKDLLPYLPASIRDFINLRIAEERAQTQLQRALLQTQAQSTQAPSLTPAQLLTHSRLIHNGGLNLIDDTIKMAYRKEVLNYYGIYFDKITNDFLKGELKPFETYQRELEAEINEDIEKGRIDKKFAEDEDAKQSVISAIRYVYNSWNILPQVQPQAQIQQPQPQAQPQQAQIQPQPQQIQFSPAILKFLEEFKKKKEKDEREKRAEQQLQEIKGSTPP